MPELKTVPVEEDAATTPNLVLTIPQPDPAFARLDADLAGRKVIIHFRTDPDDDPEYKRLVWALVPRMLRIEIGMAALDLNNACINWQAQGGIKAVVAAADGLRDQRRAVTQPPQSELVH